MDALDIAIHQTAHESGINAAECAKALGMGHQVFLNKTNPGTDTHHLSIHQALALMICTGNPAIFRALEQELTAAGVLGREVAPQPLFMAVICAASEHGDIQRSIREALGDGHISERDKADILGQCEDAILAINTLMTSVYAIKAGAFGLGASTV